LAPEKSKSRRNQLKIEKLQNKIEVVDLIEKIRLIHTHGFGHMLVYFFDLIIGQKT
jgi:hypothetical protein